MATLAEVAEWVAGIYQLETTDPALGGAPNEATGSGMINLPALQLAKRTLFLKALIEGAGFGQELGSLVTNFDTISASGFYRGAAGTTGAPNGAAPHALLHVPGNSVNNAYQVAFRIGGTNAVSYRRKNSGTWAAWVQIPDTASFGTMAEQDANSVAISGGTVSGIADLAIADGGTGASTPTAARANLGIGSAGTADVQSGPTDSTEGRVLLVGAFGLGDDAAPLIADADDATVSGFYRLGATSLNAPVYGNVYALIVAAASGGITTQIAVGSAGAAVFFRGFSEGSWTSWRAAYTSATTVPVDNGGTGATTAAAARTNLGLGSMATQSAGAVAITGGSIAGISDLAVADGGTGASSASVARTNLGAAASATTITAGIGLSGGGDLSANRTLELALGELPATDVAAFSAARFPVIDGTDSSSQGRSTATQMRNALAVYSKSEVDDLVAPAAIRALIAQTTLGVVGSYAFLRRSEASTAITKGSSIAGSSLRYAGVIDADGDYREQLELADNSAPSGTWLALGSVGSMNTQYSATLFLRIA